MRKIERIFWSIIIGSGVGLLIGGVAGVVVMWLSIRRMVELHGSASAMASLAIPMCAVAGFVLGIVLGLVHGVYRAYAQK